MKPLNKTHDEESKLVDVINRMSNQIYFADPESSTVSHSEFLAEVVQHLEGQLETIRKSRQSWLNA